MPKRPDRNTVVIWLGAGAITVGAGAALAAGPAVAHAEEANSGAHSSATGSTGHAGPKRFGASTSVGSSSGARTPTGYHRPRAASRISAQTVVATGVSPTATSVSGAEGAASGPVSPPARTVRTAGLARVAPHATNAPATAAEPAATVDPYIQKFINADPTGQFFTPATQGWDYVIQDYGHWLIFNSNPASWSGLQAYFDNIGSNARFSRNAAGQLTYNNVNYYGVDIGILYANSPTANPAGLVVAHPGEIVVVPGTYAAAELPRSSWLTTGPFIAVASPGGGSSGGGTGGGVNSPGNVLDILRNGLARIGNDIQAGIHDLLTYDYFGGVVQGFTILIDAGRQVVDSISRAAQDFFSALRRP